MADINISINDYDYDLPGLLIAYHPAKERSSGRLLYSDVRLSEIKHLNFSDIIKLIPADSHIIINETKVIAARIPALKPTGGKAEILCVEPLLPSHDPVISLAAKGCSTWKCITGGRAIRKGTVLIPQNESLSLRAEIISKKGNEAEILFIWNEDMTFAEVTDKAGKIPLPPYIKRDTTPEDKLRYQTIYAKSEGSVAAPTAGLHFTPGIIQSLKDKGVLFSEVTLHVGPGTFIPIEQEEVSAHIMHSEQIFIDLNTIEDIARSLQENKNIIATGTTSVRTIESLYWYGIEQMAGAAGHLPVIDVKQWQPYKNDASVKYTASEVFEFLAQKMRDSSIPRLYGRTSLIIVPGYNYRVINGMITNFHLPKSTLLLLVAAFTGKDLWEKAYREAVAARYRFLSYGDACLFIYPK
ncbi:MAG: S-adenosylmethionine:tRNA ribosyltransferase-isomerase [Bacteroidota bacterium]